MILVFPAGNEEHDTVASKISRRKRKRPNIVKEGRNSMQNRFKSMDEWESFIMDKYPASLTISDAAAILEIPEASVRMGIKNGKLPIGFDIGNEKSSFIIPKIRLISVMRASEVLNDQNVLSECPFMKAMKEQKNNLKSGDE
jgi:hypothetical protein